MSYFKNISSITEARLIYRRLAMLNHPDLGGNPQVMSRINMEYNDFKKSITKETGEFKNLQPGDYVIINKSKSRVISITVNTFIARSELTQRQAIFCRRTGICTSNSKFKATIQKNFSYVG